MGPVHAPRHSQFEPSHERHAGCERRRLQERMTALARFGSTFVTVAGRGDFAGVDLGRGDWGGGIGDRESLSAVEHLLRIGVVFHRMLTSSAVEI